MEMILLKFILVQIFPIIRGNKFMSLELFCFYLLEVSIFKYMHTILILLHTIIFKVLLPKKYSFYKCWWNLWNDHTMLHFWYWIPVVWVKSSNKSYENVSPCKIFSQDSKFWDTFCSLLFVFLCEYHYYYMWVLN